MGTDMKAKVITKFHDIENDIDRHPGDVFELSEERFADIEAKLPGYVERVASSAKKPASRRKAASGQKA